MKSEHTSGIYMITAAIITGIFALIVASMFKEDTNITQKTNVSQSQSTSINNIIYANDIVAETNPNYHKTTKVHDEVLLTSKIDDSKLAPPKLSDIYKIYLTDKCFNIPEKYRYISFRNRPLTQSEIEIVNGFRNSNLHKDIFNQIQKSTLITDVRFGTEVLLLGDIDKFYKIAINIDGKMTSGFISKKVCNVSTLK